MKLSTSLAQEIVRNIYDVLHQEINFMDEAGIIIASTVSLSSAPAPWRRTAGHPDETASHHPRRPPL